MDSFFQDWKHAARRLRQSPGFALAAIAAVALGIAANTAIFSVVNTVLLKPFSYREPGRIVMFQNTFPAARSGSASPTEFNWWRQQAGAFQDISGYDFGVANWTGPSLPEQIPIMRVSAGFFRLCGAGAVRGRTFAAADDLPRAPRTAVLSFAFWQRGFAADPRVIGRSLTLGGEDYEIIGVAIPRLEESPIAERSTLSGDVEIHPPPDVYLPLQIDPNSASHGHFFNVAGRLQSGVTLAAANAQLQASYPGYARTWAGEDFPGRGFAVEPLQDAIVGGVRNSLLILLGAVGLVLLIACANVANLLLARAAGRKKEIAIRAAVGAARGRIVRQLLTESLLLSLIGGLVGLAAGYAGIRAILVLLPGNIPRIGAAGVNLKLDWRVLGFTAAVSILTAVLFGVLPALDSSRAELSAVLKESGPRGGAGRRHKRTRALLVGVEAALAVVLLIGAGLLFRSFLALRRVNPGFDAHNVLTMRVDLSGPRFARPDAVGQVIREGIRRIRAVPGVEAVAATHSVPLEDRWQIRFQVVGLPPERASQAGWTLVSSGFFDAFRIPVLRGQAFTERDESGPPVIIVNQALAREFWPHSDPLNAAILVGDEPPRRVVGVVADVRDQGLNRTPRPQLYEPSVTVAGTVAWVIRTQVAPLSLSSAVQNELRAATGGLPVGEVRTMDQVLARSLAAGNFNTLVLAIFGCSALLLAAIGLYAVIACVVAERTHEIGIRLALGAESGRIRGMVVWQGLRPAWAGVICGLAAAFGLTRLLTGFLFGVQAFDPAVFFLVPVILAGVALVAVWLPASRVSRVDPIRALRSG